MTVYGYVRKGFPQSEIKQVEKIMQHKCEELFFENQLLCEEAKLKEMLEKLRPKDYVIIMTLKVFGKGLRELKTLMALFREKDIYFISIDDQVDTSNDPSFYKIFDLLLETDVVCRSERIKENINLARQGGRVIGRPAIDDHTIEQISFLYHEQKWSMRQIANECGVSLGSVYKYTQQEDCIKKETRLSVK